MPVDTEDRLLTADEAMAYLGIKRNRFYDLRRSRDIVATNENTAYDRQRGLLFSQNALDEFMKRRAAAKRQAAAQPPRES